MDRYQYGLLSEQQIRLLQIFDPKEPLPCLMHFADLSNMPHYAALSYSWDGQDREHQLESDGMALLVKKNVLSFLLSGARMATDLRFGLM